MSGVRNTTTDLQNHLFMALERLNDESLSGDALKEEIGRARAIASIARVAVDNNGTVLRVADFCVENGIGVKGLPPHVGGGR